MLRFTLSFFVFLLFFVASHAQNTLNLRASYTPNGSTGKAGLGLALHQNHNYHTLEITPFDEKLMPTSIDSIYNRSNGLRYGFNLGLGKKGFFTVGIDAMAFHRVSKHTYFSPVGLTPNTYTTNLLQTNLTVGVNKKIGKRLVVNATLPILVSELSQQKESRAGVAPSSNFVFGPNFVYGFFAPRVGLEFRIR